MNAGDHLRNVFQFPQLHDGTLKEMLDAGYTYDEVATEIGCSRAAVYHSIIRYGLRRHTRPDIEHPLMSDRAAVEAFLRAEKPSLAQLCRQFMTSGVTVRMWLRKFDLYDEWIKLGNERRAGQRLERIEALATAKAERARGKYPLLRKPEQLKEAVEARGAVAVSKEIGCHVSSVMRALKRAGIESKRISTFGHPYHPMRERAITLLEAGYNATEISKVVNASANSISQWARDEDIPQRRGRPKKVVMQ